LNTQDQVDVLVKYAVGRSGIGGIQFHRKNYSVGLSYDFPIGMNAANLGAVEIGLEYRTPVDPRSRREQARKKNLKKKPSLAKKRKQTPPKNATAKNPTSDTKVPTVLAIVKPSDVGVTPLETATFTKPVEIVKYDSVPEPKVSPNPQAEAGRINHEPYIIEKITLHFRFEYNSTDLDDDTELFLTELSKTLLINPDQSVQITGHTDNVGTAPFNHRLSLKRAEVVKEYLLRAGVPKDRVLTDGKGMDEPLNSNANEVDRARNRRIEIKLFRP
jgi:outer membrane protein OmpA-like peptidoglycan-associated protein